MKNLKHLFTVLFCFCALCIFAQTDDSALEAIIHLKNGSTFKGEILKFEKGKDLVLQLEGGDTITFREDEVARIEYQLGSNKEPSEVEKPRSNVDPNAPTQDVVRLRNGSVFRGKIIEEKGGEYYLLELEGGDVLRLDWDEIDALTEESDPGGYYEATSKMRAKKRSKAEFREEWRREREEKRSIYAFKERGWYNVTYFSSIGGEQSGEFQFGLGIHNVVGYMYNRKFGIGLGIGADTYSFQSGETIYPLYAEARGYLNKEFNSFYYALATGYGFAFKNKEEEILEARGGLMVHPSFGVRFGASEHTNMLLDFGWKLQKAHFMREFRFTGEIEVKDVWYNRFTIRLGLIF